MLLYNVITVTCYSEGDGKKPKFYVSFFFGGGGVHNVKKLMVPVIFVAVMNSCHRLYTWSSTYDLCNLRPAALTTTKK
jgi:hypothetical protein